MPQPEATDRLQGNSHPTDAASTVRCDITGAVDAGNIQTALSKHVDCEFLKTKV